VAAALIETIRHGQAVLADQLLADLGVQRGLLTAEQSAAALATAPPGELCRELVASGVVSRPQVEALAGELEVLELMQTARDDNAPAEVQRASLMPGRRLGRYVLAQEIGAGGMGIVWKAWDTQLARWVAVKRLKVRDPKLVSRFMREASLLAQLSHPNITTVFEIGVHEGQPFLVMELVSGGSPEAGKLGRKEAARIVRDAARAVQYAHARRIIHRDLKPANLLVDAEGRVFVTDFGLARMREEAASLTVSGALLGTPAFMAPEQAQGLEADHRTDVYGLGATLYALVEGKPPHTGELVHEVVKRVAIANPPTLGGCDDLVVVAQKALERDREDRYQSAGELADELDRFIADEPIHARNIGTVERTWRRAKRRPAAAAAVAAALAITIGASAYGGLRVQRYYARAAAIEAAQPFVSSGETIAGQLRTLYASQTTDPDWESTGLENLEREADAALAAAPGYAPAEYLKGLVHLWRDEHTAAHEHFSAALVADPTHAPARVYRVAALSGASAAVSPVIVQDASGFRIVAAPSSPAKSDVLAQMEQDLTALPPKHALTGLASALLTSARGEFAASYETLEAHLAEHPYDQKMRGLLLYTLLAVGRFDEAITVAESMLARRAFPASAYGVIAFARAGLGDLAAAAAAMEQSVTLAPNLDGEQWIAFWQLKQRQFDAAFARYASILERDPEHVQARLGRAAALTLLGQEQQQREIFEAARADAQRAVELAPNDAYAQFVLGQAVATLDQPAAIAAYRRAIELDREHFAADGEAMIAATHALHGDFPAAIASLEGALELRPGHSAWLNLLARFHVLADEPAKAVEIVRGRSTDSDSLQILASAVRMLIAGGDCAAARAALPADTADEALGAAAAEVAATCR
jgi:serine/threonine-protein kinase